MANEFWLEATMIEYNIIEDQTAAIIYYAGVASKPREKKLANKLESINYQIGKGHPIISRKVSADTIQRIKDWKTRRNDSVHKACYTTFDEDNFRAISEEGKELVSMISNDSQKVKRADEKGLKL